MKGDRARALSAVPSKMHALLGDFVLLAGGLVGTRSGTLWRRRVAVLLAFLEDMATWGGNRDPTQVEGQLGRSIGGGSPRESGILAGTWFSRDQLHWTAGESLKFTKELLSSLSPWDSHALLEPGRHGRTQRGASWCHQALGPV